MNRANVEPNYEQALILVRYLNDEELKKYVNDDDAVAELVKNIDQCKQLETEKELIMTQNKSLAEYNLSLAPKLEKGRSKLKEIYESIQSAWDNVQEKQTQIRSSIGDLSRDTALALLQTAAAESEEESENITDKFYQKEIEMEDFLEQFQNIRKQMHLRRVKADKMKDLISQKSGSTNSSIPYPKLPAAVPYPVGPLGMMNMPYFPMAK